MLSVCVAALSCHPDCVFTSPFQKNPVPAWTKPCDHIWPKGMHAADPTSSDVSPHRFWISTFIFSTSCSFPNLSRQAVCATIVWNIWMVRMWQKKWERARVVLNMMFKRRFANSLLSRPATDKHHFLTTTPVVTPYSIALLLLKGLFLRSCQTLEASPQCW